MLRRLGGNLYNTSALCAPPSHWDTGSTTTSTTAAGTVAGTPRPLLIPPDQRAVYPHRFPLATVWYLGATVSVSGRPGDVRLRVVVVLGVVGQITRLVARRTVHRPSPRC